MIKTINRFCKGFKVLLLPAAAILSLAFLLLPNASQADGRKLNAEEVNIVSSVNDYLNSFDNMEGYFVQTGPSGKFTSGRFFMSRPGRIRFEYEPPSPLMIVADGTWVSIENRKLKTSEHYPLRTTPLKIILAKNINLLKSADVTQAFRDESRITVTLHDRSLIDNGEITLVFQTEDMVLKEWIVIDAQGLQTRVSVSELVTGIQRSQKLFFIKKPDFPESDR